MLLSWWHSIAVSDVNLSVEIIAPFRKIQWRMTDKTIPTGKTNSFENYMRLEKPDLTTRSCVRTRTEKRFCFFRGLFIALKRKVFYSLELAWGLAQGKTGEHLVLGSTPPHPTRAACETHNNILWQNCTKTERFLWNGHAKWRMPGRVVNWFCLFWLILQWLRLQRNWTILYFVCILCARALANSRISSNIEWRSKEVLIVVTPRLTSLGTHWDRGFPLQCCRFQTKNFFQSHLWLFWKPHNVEKWQKSEINAFLLMMLPWSESGYEGSRKAKRFQIDSKTFSLLVFGKGQNLGGYDQWGTHWVPIATTRAHFKWSCDTCSSSCEPSLCAHEQRVRATSLFLPKRAFWTLKCHSCSEFYSKNNLLAKWEKFHSQFWQPYLSSSVCLRGKQSSLRMVWSVW